MRPQVKNIPYYVCALACALVIFLLISWIPAVGFWLSIINGASFLTALQLTAHLFLSALADSSLFATLFNSLVALLVGANIALLTYYWRHYRTAPSKASSATSVAGTLITFLGFGCASCGTLFITYLLTSLGATSLTTFPLFNSTLLQTIGVFILAYSTFQLYKKTNDPLVCY